MTDHHATLGVARGATRAEIDRAYRARAMDAHPDRGGNNSLMAELNQARGALTAKAAEFDDPQLDAIKALVRDKSHTEIRRVLEDTLRHIRSFTDRGPTGYGGGLDDPRLHRHRREAAYLKGLIS